MIVCGDLVGVTPGGDVLESDDAAHPLRYPALREEIERVDMDEVRRTLKRIMEGLDGG